MCEKKVGDLTGGDFFRKKAGEQLYMKLGPWSTRYLGLDESMSYGVACNGNIVKLPNDKKVVAGRPLKFAEQWVNHHCRPIGNWVTLDQEVTSMKTEPTNTPHSEEQLLEEFKKYCGFCMAGESLDSCWCARDPQGSFDTRAKNECSVKVCPFMTWLRGVLPSSSQHSRPTQTCPECRSTNTTKTAFEGYWECDDCGHEWKVS